MNLHTYRYTYITLFIYIAVTVNSKVISQNSLDYIIYLYILPQNYTT